MNRLKSTAKRKALRQSRTRSNIYGTATRPRLSVNLSNRNVTAQIINDEISSTLVYASTVGQKSAPANMTEKAKFVGEAVATKALKVKIDTIVFDRGAKLYHGRIKDLAEAARSKGLKF